MTRWPVVCAALLVGCGFLEDPKPRPEAGAGGSPTTTSTSSTTSSSSGGGLDPLPVGGAGGNAATVMTWNLETFPLFPGTLARAAELVQALEPDVVAIQEVTDPDAFAELAAATGYDGILNDDPGNFLRLGLLTRPERVTVSDVTTLFAGDELRFPRPPLLAHVAIQGDSMIDFDVVVVHLKAQVDPDSRERRRLACVALEEWVTQRLAQSTEQDLMVLGDFNDALLDPPEVNVFTSFLDKPGDYQFLSLDAEQAGDFSYIPFEAMIDHVMVTTDMVAEVGDGDTEVLTLDKSVVSYSEISDHRPVRTWLHW